MKTLSLYIDRWYIAAAICCDGISRRIELPNHEDRIWLYFYEDVYNERVIYGKNYQQHFLDKEMHYYGDIFSKIVKVDETFKNLGHDVDIKGIFRTADIFEHLKKDFPNKKEIDTYVSFSIDVSYAAQKVFLDILKENDFRVIESVARISHLALELSYRKGLINNANNILIAIACNENLRYIVYKQINGVFVRKAEEGVLRGFGTDLRGRALLEQIVKQINKVDKFLKEDEIEFEILRLSQHIEPWLLHLDNNTKYGRPVIYNDITFSRAPHNKVNATIIRSDIEKKTKLVIEQVVDNIAQYVKSIGVVPADISHILFIGNSFRNSMFTDALLQKYAINSSNIISYIDKDLPNIVSIYNQMDLSQFKALRADIEHLSSEQLEQIRIAEEDRKSQEEEIRIQDEINNANTAAREAEKKYNDAIGEAENYEKKADYGSMIDMLNIALTVKPESTEAKQMLDEANRKLSEIKVRNEQYNKIIRIAQDAFNDQRWQEAYTKSESALELFPDSAEAKRINTDSLKKIKLAETLKDLLLRADIFIGQKLYAEAKEELNKAKLVDANNKEIKSRIEKIDSILNKQKKDIEELEKKISETKEKKDYDDAIKYCKELLNIDYANQRKWNEEIINLQAIRKKEKADAQLFEDLKRQIGEANCNEQYEVVVNLCNQALKIKEDGIISGILKKSEAKLKILKEQQEFEDAVSKIKALIADKSWKKAKSLTKDLQNNYPEYNDVVKQLFKTIFDAQENWNDKKEESTSSKRQPIGFKPPKETGPIKTDDWDWDSPKKQNIQKIEKSAASERKPQPKKSNDDFFDMNSKTETKTISNKDFDF